MANQAGELRVKVIVDNSEGNARAKETSTAFAGIGNSAKSGVATASAAVDSLTSNLVKAAGATSTLAASGKSFEQQAGGIAKMDSAVQHLGESAHKAKHDVDDLFTVDPQELTKSLEREAARMAKLKQSFAESTQPRPKGSQKIPTKEEVGDAYAEASAIARAKAIQDLETKTQRALNSELTGLQRIEAERKIVLAEMDKSAETQSRINKLFDQQAGVEKLKQQVIVEKAHSAALIENEARTRALGKAQLAAAAEGEKRAKASLDAITKEQAGTRALGQNINQFIQNPLSAAGNAAETFAVQFGTVGVVLAGVALGAVVAGGYFLSLAADVGKTAEHFANLSAETGLSTYTIQVLSHAADITGVSFGGILAASRKLSEGLSENTDEGIKARVSMEALGIKTKDAVTQGLRPFDDILLDVFRHLADIPNANARILESQRILGKGSQAFLPLIANITELQRVIHETNVVMGEESLKAAADYDDSLDKLGKQWEALRHTLGLKAIGVIQFIAPQLTGKPSEAQGVERIFDALGITDLNGHTFAQRRDAIAYKAKVDRDKGEAATREANAEKLRKDKEDARIKNGGVPDNQLAELRKSVDAELEVYDKLTEGTKHTLKKLGVAEKTLQAERDRLRISAGNPESSPAERAEAFKSLGAKDQELKAVAANIKGIHDKEAAEKHAAAEAISHRKAALKFAEDSLEKESEGLDRIEAKRAHLSKDLNPTNKDIKTQGLIDEGTKSEYDKFFEDFTRKTDKALAHFLAQNKKAIRQNAANLLAENDAANQQIERQQEAHEENLRAAQLSAAGFRRTAELEELNGLVAINLEGRLAINQQRTKIELRYADERGRLEDELLATRAAKELEDREKVLDAQARAGIISWEQYYSLLGGLQQQQQDSAIAAHVRLEAEKAEITARARNEEKALIREHYINIFDSVKSGTNNVLDDILDRGKTLGAALRDQLKSSFKSALKDVISSQVAGAFTQLITGVPTTVKSSVGGNDPLSKIAQAIGLKGRPVFGDQSPDNLKVSKLEQNNHIGDVTLKNGALPVVLMGSASPGGQVTPVASGSRGGAFTGLLAALGGSLGGGGSLGKAGSVVSSGISSTMDGHSIGGGSTYYPGTPPFLPDPSGSGVGWGGRGSSGSGGGLSSIFKGGGLKQFFGQGDGSVLLSPGNATTTATLGGKLGGFATSQAAGAIGSGLVLNGLSTKGNTAAGSAQTIGGAGLLGSSMLGKQFGAVGGALIGVGAGLGADGLKRGGLTGLGETTAGGALIGFQLGGPAGAAIGAAVGFAAGAIRLLVKGAAEKVQKKIKDLYNLSIDKGLAQQIADIAKQSYGGNLDMAVRSNQVLDLLSLYAQSTNQAFGIKNQVRPTTLVNSAAGLQQMATYENGRALSEAGGLSVYGGVQTQQIQAPSYTNGTMDAYQQIPGGSVGANGGSSQPLSITLQLHPEATSAILEGRAIEALTNNPRVVQTASNSATAGNFGRMQQAGMFFNPAELTG